MDAEDFVFFDVSGAWLNFTRLYARAPLGERAYDVAPKRKGGKLSLLAAISAQGLNPTQCLIHEGAMDTNAFLSYLQKVLVPSLKKGQVVILDNFTVHHNHEARRLIEAKGCYLLFLPTYSPDFNPIELLFSKIKAYLRKCKPRATEALMTVLQEALTMVTPQEVRACFSHCGYL